MGLHNDAVTTTVPPRSAFDDPVEVPPARWVGALVLLNLGVVAGWFGPIQVLLAQQADRIAAAEAGGMSKEALLAVVLFSGAAVSMVANPVWGAFSDRTRSRLGRRVPWVLGGVLLGAASLLLLSVAESAALMVSRGAWCSCALNAASAGGSRGRARPGAGRAAWADRWAGGHRGHRRRAARHQDRRADRLDRARATS